MNNPYAAYMESNILSASPVELVGMLYTAAGEAIRDARRFLAEGKIPERAAAVSRAVEILAELNSSLDPAAGELTARLAQLYDYMQRRLLEANFQQADGPLEETQGLVETLAEAWKSVAVEMSAAAPQEEPEGTAEQAVPDVTSPWSQAFAPEPAYASEGWQL